MFSDILNDFKNRALSREDPSQLNERACLELLKIRPRWGVKVKVLSQGVVLFLNSGDFEAFQDVRSKIQSDSKGQLDLGISIWPNELLKKILVINAGHAKPARAELEALELRWREKIELCFAGNGADSSEAVFLFETSRSPLRDEIVIVDMPKIQRRKCRLDYQERTLADLSGDSFIKDLLSGKENPRSSFKNLTVVAFDGSRIRLSDRRPGQSEELRAYLQGLSRNLSDAFLGSLVDVKGKIMARKVGGNPTLELQIHSIQESGLQDSRQEESGEPMAPLELSSRPRDISFEIVSGAEKLEQVLISLKDAPMFSCDVETVKDPLYSGSESFPPQRIALISIYDPQTRKAWLIDPLTDFKPELLKAILNLENPKKVFHYADFDLKWLESNFGITASGVQDTRLIAMELFPFFMNFSLQTLASYCCGIHLNKDADIRQGDWTQRPLDKERCSYALDDVLATATLYEYLKDLEDKASADIPQELPGLFGALKHTWGILSFEMLSGKPTLAELMCKREELVFTIQTRLANGALPYDNEEEFGTARMLWKKKKILWRVFRRKMAELEIEVPQEHFPVYLDDFLQKLDLMEFRTMEKEYVINLAKRKSVDVGLFHDPKRIQLCGFGSVRIRDLGLSIPESMKILQDVQKEILSRIFSEGSQLPFLMLRQALIAKKIIFLARKGESYSEGEQFVEAGENRPILDYKAFSMALKKGKEKFPAESSGQREVSLVEKILDDVDSEGSIEDVKAFLEENIGTESRELLKTILEQVIEDAPGKRFLIRPKL